MEIKSRTLGSAMNHRLLGIDYGEKRIGLALSNEDKTMAFPKGVIENDGNALEKIAAICQSEGVKAAVIGESRNFKGEENKIMGGIRMFKNMLGNKAGIPVYFEPEFMTSVEASRLQGNVRNLDASAAALILKSFLERHKNINL